MTRLHRLFESSPSMLGPNRVEAIAGTSKLARDGHVILMKNMDISAFVRSGTILFGHDPDQPVGTPFSGRVDGEGSLRLVIDFAAEGVSARADEVRALVKTGVVRNLSIGFEVLDAEPLDKNKPRGGLLVTRSELLECSFVSIPADTDAVVTARAGRAGKVLSGTNTASLRQAHDMAESCRSAIADVLSGAGEGLGDESERARRRRQAEMLALAAPGDPWFERRQRQLEALQLNAVDPNYGRRQREVARQRGGPRR